MRAAALSAALLVPAACTSGAGADPVRRGVLTAPSPGTALRLAGDWRFFSGPADGGAGEVYLRVPGVWGSPPGNRGRGIYQVVLEGLLPGEVYALQFKGIASRASIRVDGEVVGAWGAEGPSLLPRTYSFHAHSASAVVTAAVENESYFYGGIWLPVLFGSSAAVERASARDRVIDAFVLGAIVMMGLYHLALFSLRYKDRAPLYFGLFCLATALKAGLSQEQLLTLMIPPLDGIPAVRTSYLATVSLPLLFLLYVQALFPAKATARILAGGAAVGLGYALFVAMVPLDLLQIWFLPYQLLILALCVYIFVLLATRAVMKAPGAAVLLLGFILIAAAALNDILHDNRIIFTFYGFNLGLFLFVFSQSFVMGTLLTRNYRLVEDANAALESRVAERTKELENLARIDPLTGLLNRRCFWEILAGEWERRRRYDSEFCLAMVDLDRFKAINDTYGHAAGDRVLKTVGVLLRENVRKTDSVGRFGGEEFCLLIHEVKAVEALAVLEKIRRALAESDFDLGTGPIGITLSYGIAQASKHPNPEALLDAADKLMYRAKQEGRNRGFAEE